MIGVSSIKNATHVPVAARNRKNGAFLYVCLAFTSISVLCLGVLLASVFLNGTKHLFNFQIQVLPHSAHLVEFHLDEDSRAVELSYFEEITRDIPLETKADLAGASLETDSGDLFLVLNDGTRQRIATADSLVSQELNIENRTARLVYGVPSQESVGIPGDGSLEGASIAETEDGRVVFTYPDGKEQVIATRGSAVSRLTMIGDPSLRKTGEFLGGSPSVDPRKAGFESPLVGTIWLLCVCALAAVPIGIGTAIFLEEFKPTSRLGLILHRIVATNIRNLAGVPSVVYGLIGLTVFARMFGLLGTPLDYQSFDVYNLKDGTQVVGITTDIQSDVYTLNGPFIGESRLERTKYESISKFPTDGEVIQVTGTVEFTDDYEFQFETEQLGSFVLSPFDILSGEMIDEDPFPPRPFEATFALEGQARYVVETVRDGRVFVPRDMIADATQDIDKLRIRSHSFELKDGRRIVGKIPELSDGTITVRADLQSEPVTFTIDEVKERRNGKLAYSTKKMITFLDEDHPLHIRLPMGASVLAGGLTLMLVILPVVIIASQEALRAVPDSLRQGALALGASKWQMVWTMTLPSSIPGIMTGCILAMSRAIGEAAPILIIGGVTFVTFTPDNLMSGFAAMPLQIYDWLRQPDLEFQRVAASGIIVLMTVLLAFNGIAIVIRQKLQRPLN
ncbi:MAG: ABC transporter permease subunit [Phycisphaerales bacterium JB065]